MKTRQIRITSKNLGNHVGQLVRVDTDPQGTPLELAWRRRLEAGMCEFIEEKPPALVASEE